MASLSSNHSSPVHSDKVPAASARVHKASVPDLVDSNNLVCKEKVNRSEVDLRSSNHYSDNHLKVRPREVLLGSLRKLDLVHSRVALVSSRSSR